MRRADALELMRAAIVLYNLKTIIALTIMIRAGVLELIRAYYLFENDVCGRRGTIIDLLERDICGHPGTQTLWLLTTSSVSALRSIGGVERLLGWMG